MVEFARLMSGIAVLDTGVVGYERSIFGLPTLLRYVVSTARSVGPFTLETLALYDDRLGGRTSGPTWIFDDGAFSTVHSSGKQVNSCPVARRAQAIRLMSF